MVLVEHAELLLSVRQSRQFVADWLSAEDEDLGILPETSHLLRYTHVPVRGEKEGGERRRSGRENKSEGREMEGRGREERQGWEKKLGENEEGQT